MSTQLAIANAETTDAQATLTFETATGAADAGRGRRAGAVAPDGGSQHRAGAGGPVVLDAARVRPAAGARSPRLAERARARRRASRPPSTSRRRRGTSPKARRSIRMELFYLVQNPGATPANVRSPLPAAERPARRSCAPTRWPPAAAPPSGSIAKIRRWRPPTWRRRSRRRRRADRRRAQPLSARGGLDGAARRRHQHRRHGSGDAVVRRRRDGPLHDAPAPRQPGRRGGATCRPPTSARTAAA